MELNKQSAITPQNAAAEPEAQAAPAKRSVGERMFDWFTYGGLAWIGTFIATIPLAYYMKHEGGEKHYKKAAEFLAKKKVNPALSKGLMETFITMQGGNAMILPIIAAEHYKVPIVKGLNRLMNDPTDPSTIEEAPKQTAGSLVLGRLTAFLTVFACFFGARSAFKDTFSTFEHEFASHTSKLLGKPPHPGSKTYRLGEIAALDVFATTASAVLLYVSSHFLAKKAYAKKQPTPAVERETGNKTNAPLRDGEIATDSPLLPKHEETADAVPTLKVSNAQHDAPLVHRGELQVAAH